MTAVEIPPGENPYAAAGPNEWETREIERLRQMDAFVAPVTAAALEPVLAEASAAAAGAGPAKLLDVGGGVGTTTEELSKAHGVDYTIADLNERFLGFRETRDDHKVVANAEDLPLPDGSFDVAHSRATVAWTKDPSQALDELLRVTKKDGGTVVVTDFDWSQARADMDSGAMEAVMEVRAIFMGALISQGFRPDYGTVSGADIDAAAEARGLKATRTESRVEFPQGDHSAFLLEMVQPLLTHLRGAHPPTAAVLESDMAVIKRASEAGTVSMRLPALVTQVVRLAGVQQPESAQ